MASIDYKATRGGEALELRCRTETGAGPCDARRWRIVRYASGETEVKCEECGETYPIAAAVSAPVAEES